MKKIKNLVILILFLFLSITIVQAENDIFKYAWEKELIDNQDFEYVLMTTKEKFKNGYFISTFGEMKYYDTKGKILAQKEIENSAVLSAKEVDDYLYAFLISGETQEFKLVKMDQDLNIIKEAIIENETGDMFISLYLSAVKYAGYNFISTVNDEITIAGSEGGDLALLHYDKDLNYKSKDVLTRYNYELAEPYYEFIVEFMKENENAETAPEVISLLSDSINSKRIYNGANTSQCPNMYLDLSESAAEPCHLTSVLKLEESGSIIFNKEYDDYLAIINSKIVGKYIIALGINNIEDITQLQVNSELDLLNELQSEVLVIDMEGNIIQRIKNDSQKYVSIVPSETGFIVNKFNLIPTDDNSNYTITMGVEAFDILHEVQTKVTGKGTITVVNTSVAGESVTYVVTPENGYVLGKVIITDEAGNIIETTENTFTMPTSSVTIEAIFEPANPETEDITIMSLAIILLFGSILTLVNYRRLRNIR